MDNKDHPDQAVDTPIPDGEKVDAETWEAMRDEALATEADAAATEAEGYVDADDVKDPS